MNNIDSQINDRMQMYSGNPQALQQRYAQTQELVDLLALQKMKNDRAAATSAVQGAMQTSSNTVKGQLEQEAMQGSRNDVLRSMAPGIQQQGQRMAQMQNRAAMGLSGQAAPNMARMADGGIVGYQEGGFMGPPEPNLYQRIGQGLKNYGTNAQESMDILRAAKAGIGVPYGNRSAAIQQVRDQIAAEKQNRDPNFIQRMGQKLMDTGLDVEESKAILRKFYNNIGKTYEQKASGMAQGGIVGYNSRGSVNLLDAALEAEGITDPATIELIRSIYAQESSSGQDTGVSPAGARGPMQVMPATFTEMMGSDADINDPITNLRAGSRYAQQMLTRAKGDPRLAAAGYYGGPGGMNKLRAGNDTEAPQDGFPSISAYADEVVARLNSRRPPAIDTTGAGDLEAAGIDPSFYASTFNRGDKNTTSVEAEDEPFIDLGALFELIGKGKDYLLSPSRATQEARDIRQGEVEQASERGVNLLNILPPSEGLTAEQLASFDEFDVTGSLPLQIVEERRERVESGEAAKALEQQATRRAEANATRREGKPTMPQNEGITADMYMTPKKELTVAQKLMQLPKVAREPAKREEKGLDIDFRALREFLTAGGGQTSTAGALGAGARGLGAYQTAERARMDKIQQAADELQLKRDLATNDARMLSARLTAEYKGKLDTALLDIAQDALENAQDPLNQEFQTQAAAIRQQFARQPAVMNEAIDQLYQTTVNKAVERARRATGLGEGSTTSAGPQVAEFVGRT